jgi:UDPglucose 6-dehydrogenase
MDICVIGTGYVGVVTAAVFSHLGHRVYGLDIDQAKIDLLNQGKSPIFEPGLEPLLVEGIKAKRLFFGVSYQEVIPKSKVIFICVGTPPKPDGSYDPKYVFNAAQKIGQNLRDGSIIVIKSTVPPSTTKEVDKIIKSQTSCSYSLASIPEFLREGTAVSDAIQPSRIVIGVEDPKTLTVLLDLHQKFKTKKIICDITSAQLVKYAANAFLATKISFINSLAIIADKIGADIDCVARGFGSDPRIGESFLQAGLGYGGSCFPKDTHALIAYSHALGYDFSFLKQVDKINDQQIQYFISKIKKLAKGSLKSKTIALLGLAFKPNTDDLREARSIQLIERLLDEKVKVRVYDPAAMDNARKIFGNRIYFAADPYDCLTGADVGCLVTEWPEFGKLDWSKVKRLMAVPTIADGRNCLDKEKLKKLGFSYQGIGRR